MQWSSCRASIKGGTGASFCMMQEVASFLTSAVPQQAQYNQGTVSRLHQTGSPGERAQVAKASGEPHDEHGAGHDFKHAKSGINPADPPVRHIGVPDPFKNRTNSDADADKEASVDDGVVYAGTAGLNLSSKL